MISRNSNQLSVIRTRHRLLPAMHAHGAQLSKANWVAVTHEPDGSVCFVYRAFGTRGMLVFVWILFFAATGFLYMTVYNNDVMPWPIMAMFAVINLCGLGFVLWLTFGNTRLRLTANELILERGLWNFRQERRVLKSSIIVVRQIDEHDEQCESDDFPSFSLKLEGEQPCMILSHQDSDRSDYLGTEIAQWAGVPYVSAGNRKQQSLVIGSNQRGKDGGGMH